MGHGSRQNLLRQFRGENHQSTSAGSAGVNQNGSTDSATSVRGFETTVYEGEEGFVTYEVLHGMVERVLKECGYYSVPEPGVSGAGGSGGVPKLLPVTAR